ncbi:MAG: hypothetical protein K2P58_01585 [Hyphomonadaceae bacterium]|nr:hypothetical protein [Hyphomonadaceae bacterium]
MRVVFKRGALAVCAVAILMASMAASASAQPVPPNCAGFASPPALPDGATASHGRMASTGRAVEAWRLEREGKLALCRSDIDALRAQLNAMEHAFNQAGSERNNVLGAWNAEVTEFTERRRRRD